MSKPITRAEIHGILADCEGVGLPEHIDDETLLVIDSYAAVWIQHLLEERHGVVVQLSGQTAGIESVGDLQALISRSQGEVDNDV